MPFFFGPLEPEPLEKNIQLLFAFPLKIRKLLFAFPFKIRQFLFAFSFNTGVYIKFEMYFPPFLIYIFSPNEIWYNEGVRALDEKFSGRFCAIL